MICMVWYDMYRMVSYDMHGMINMIYDRIYDIVWFDIKGIHVWYDTQWYDMIYDTICHNNLMSIVWKFATC